MTLVLAHRGASWCEPENTLPAFERAIEEEADYVEFDVRAARDGSLVVTHDRVRGELAPGVPTLDAVLETCAGRVGLAVEIKEDALAERVLERLAAHGVEPDSVLVLSFLRRALATTRRLRPDLRTVQHVARVPLRRAAAYAWGVGFEDRAAGARRIAAAQALGLATTVYTVNDPARMRELVALGVTGIFTDRPGLLRRTLAG